jgi:Na+/H+ antiporter NhaD/arsenite permease-like protein
MSEGYIIISRLLLGFMVTTMTLSMWISNTATTAMMTPIVKAVLDELKQVGKNVAAIRFCHHHLYFHKSFTFNTYYI